VHEKLVDAGIEAGSALYYHSIEAGVARAFPADWAAYCSTGHAMNAARQQRGAANSGVSYEQVLQDRACWAQMQERTSAAARPVEDTYTASSVTRIMLAHAAPGGAQQGGGLTEAAAQPRSATTPDHAAPSTSARGYQSSAAVNRLLQRLNSAPANAMGGSPLAGPVTTPRRQSRSLRSSSLTRSSAVADRARFKAAPRSAAQQQAELAAAAAQRNASDGAQAAAHAGAAVARLKAQRFDAAQHLRASTGSLLPVQAERWTDALPRRGSGRVESSERASGPALGTNDAAAQLSASVKAGSGAVRVQSEAWDKKLSPGQALIARLARQDAPGASRPLSVMASLPAPPRPVGTAASAASLDCVPSGALPRSQRSARKKPWNETRNFDTQLVYGASARPLASSG